MPVSTSTLLCGHPTTLLTSDTIVFSCKLDMNTPNDDMEALHKAGRTKAS